MREAQVECVDDFAFTPTPLPGHRVRTVVTHVMWWRVWFRRHAVIRFRLPGRSVATTLEMTPRVWKGRWPPEPGDVIVVEMVPKFETCREAQP